jgi:hypothetical protein
MVDTEALIMLILPHLVGKTITTSCGGENRIVEIFDGCFVRLERMNECPCYCWPQVVGFSIDEEGHGTLTIRG